MNNDIKRGGLVVATLLGCLVLAVSAQGASFDCGKAGTKVEHIICDNPEISKLDDELSVAYKAALIDEKQAVSVKQAQKLWMTKRDACADAACVKRTYETRMAELRSINGVVAQHDEYILVKQNLDETTDYLFHIVPDPKVCQLYLENLNYFAHQNIPMSCNRPIAPQLKSRIQEMEWEDLKPADYPELFRQAVLYETFGKGKSSADLGERAKLVATKAYYFRRATFTLSGKLNGQVGLYGEQDRSHKEYSGQFYIVQYGSNHTDINRSVLPCKPVRGNQPGENYLSGLATYVVSNDMNDVVKPLGLGVGPRELEGEHMRLIDGKPYVEHIETDASIYLYRVGLVTLETLCQYRFETSCRLPGKETFDPDQPMCKPNLD